MIRSVRCLVRGLVQGVFFRDSARRVAEALRINGHAINLPDGSVEVLASGKAESVDSLCLWLQDGPARARVDSVECEAWESEIPSGFRIG